MSINTIKVFISSPSDVGKERIACGQIINKINSYIEEPLGIRFKEQKYENLSPDLENVQEYINKKLPMDQMSILIGILWCRMGTPTENYISGTAEEFCKAYDLWKKIGTPRVMFFHNIAKPPQDFDKSQKQLVDKFVENFPGFIKKYEKFKDFEDYVTSALMEYAFDFYKNERTKLLTNELAVNQHAKNFGLDRIYFQNDKRSREDDKRQAMLASKHIYLLAHAGYSFLVEQADRLFNELVQSLENDCEVRIILTNPYSESGFLISLADEDSVTNITSSFLELTESVTRKPEMLEIINHSSWVNVKLFPAFNGYEDLKKRYHDKISLKLLSYEMAASILITDSCCFVEPYVVVKRSERGMTTYEIKINSDIDDNTSSTKKSVLYNNYFNYFEFLWGISDDYESKKEAILNNKYKKTGN